MFRLLYPNLGDEKKIWPRAAKSWKIRFYTYVVYVFIYCPFIFLILYSDSGALLHLIKSSLGSGILAMPNAFKNGGLFFGLFGTAAIGALCTHCIYLLVSQVFSFYMNMYFFLIIVRLPRIKIITPNDFIVFGFKNIFFNSLFCSAVPNWFHQKNVFEYTKTFRLIFDFWRSV